MSDNGISPNLRYHFPPRAGAKALDLETDVCIYGGTSAGLAAAVQVRKMGKRCVVLEAGRHLGGLSSGGLGATDIGNKDAIGGISRGFYRALGQHYGNPENWTFEPHAAAAVFQDWIVTHDLAVHTEQQLVGVRKDGARLTEIALAGGGRVRAAMWLDATYEGDLLARAGVSYTVGREGNARYDENHNGVLFGHPNHNFITFVDPYVRPGDPASGLLPGVFGPSGQQGEGDRRVQAYNFRMCLTDDPAIRAPFPKPAAYDPARYELLLRYLRSGVWDVLRLTTRMPNGKTDTNNFGAFSTDNIGMNYAWPEADYAAREAIFQDHVAYQAGLFWFLANDPRVPAHVREETNRFGLAADEFNDTGHWPPQLYVREARRMVSDVVMTEHHCVGRDVVPDPISLAAYGMDSHNCNRQVRGGRVMNEGNVEFRVPRPFGVSYCAITPRRAEAENLLVPVCASTSHPAYGSIRMEPVFMILGQSAATAAVLALAESCPVQALDYARLRAQLLADGQVLEWAK